MYVKVTTLTVKPTPRTNINEGFQSLVNAKKDKIFVLLTIPATNKPQPNMMPTRKRTN